MSFQTYKPTRTGRGGLKGAISIGTAQIGFGSWKPPYEYLVVEYDTENLAIRFSEGDISNGFKVHFSKGKNWYFINAHSFSRHGYLPRGRYQKVGELTYVHTAAPSATDTAKADTAKEGRQ